MICISEYLKEIQRNLRTEFCVQNVTTYDISISLMLKFDQSVLGLFLPLFTHPVIVFFLFFSQFLCFVFPFALMATPHLMNLVTPPPHPPSSFAFNIKINNSYFSYIQKGGNAGLGNCLWCLNNTDTTSESLATLQRLIK